MQNFQESFETRKGSFVSAFSNYMTAPTFKLITNILCGIIGVNFLFPKAIINLLTVENKEDQWRGDFSQNISQ